MLMDAGLAAVFDSISIADLARKLGISTSAIYQWDRVPVARVLEIERLTGVSRNIQRPDIYGPALAPAAEGATLATDTVSMDGRG